MSAVERDRLGHLRDDYAVLLGLAKMWLSDIRERQFLLGDELASTAINGWRVRHRIVEDSGLIGSRRVAQLNEADVRLQRALQQLDAAANHHLRSIEVRIVSDA